MDTHESCMTFREDLPPSSKYKLVGNQELTMREREDFCRVGERYGALSGGVKGIVDINE